MNGGGATSPARYANVAGASFGSWSSVTGNAFLTPFRGATSPGSPALPAESEGSGLTSRKGVAP